VSPIDEEGVGAMSISERIATFITENFYVPAGSEVPFDASLLDSGIIDSTGVLEVIEFLEREFGITVEDHEVVPENLDSVDRLSAFVAKKSGAAAAPEGARAEQTTASILS
jgi:acyl carrier protein